MNESTKGILICTLFLAFVVIVRVSSAADAGDVVSNSIGMKLVWIPPGEFMMGSDNGSSNEKPVHRVTISKGFWMGQTEVTQDQYRAVTGDSPSAWRWKKDNLPLENITWDDVTWDDADKYGQVGERGMLQMSGNALKKLGEPYRTRLTAFLLSTRK